jgi:hypothetical protein
MSAPGMLPPEMEMANLEHELAVLRERYSTMLREAKRTRWISKYGVGVIVAVLSGAVIYFGSRSSDALPVLFLVTGLVAVIGLMVWLCTGWFPDDQKSGFYLYDERYPFRTDEEFLNHAIAIREKRLNELKATP